MFAKVATLQLNCRQYKRHKYIRSLANCAHNKRHFDARLDTLTLGFSKILILTPVLGPVTLRGFGSKKPCEDGYQNKGLCEHI
jgi:hypothetical protein